VIGPYDVLPALAHEPLRVLGLSAAAIGISFADTTDFLRCSLLLLSIIYTLLKIDNALNKPKDDE